MNYAKKMFLVTPEEYSIIKGGNHISTSNSPDQEIKSYHEQFLKQKTRNEIAEDQGWQKLEKRISPILQAGLTNANENKKTNDEKWKDILDGIIANFENPSFRNRARDFLIRLRRVPGITITDKEVVYNDGSKAAIDIVDIISDVIHGRQRLLYDLEEFLQILKKDNFPTNLIYNKQALDFFRNTSNISDSHSRFMNDSFATPPSKSTPVSKSTPASHRRGVERQSSTRSVKKTGHGPKWDNY